VLNVKSIGLNFQLGPASLGGTTANRFVTKPPSLRTVDRATTHLHLFSDIYQNCSATQLNTPVDPDAREDGDKNILEDVPAAAEANA
jgi:hypothetical protein